MAKSITVSDLNDKTLHEIDTQIGFPCFIKPNKGGSSVGISRVDAFKDLKTALQNGFKEDSELIVEEFIEGTEITCGVALVSGKPKAIGITEIVFTTSFFDYKAKYTDKTTQEITPARIPQNIYKQCCEVSEKIYSFLNCKSFIRIDYIIKNERLYLIEVNTIPGMTDASLIPQHFEHQKIGL